MIAPKRRWFQFRLRTLFVVVTVFGACLGWFCWELKAVRHRKALRAEIESEGVFVSDGGAIDWTHSILIVQIRRRLSPYRPSTIGRLLGDRPIFLIGFDRQLTPADSRTIEAFPEAEIHAIPADGGPKFVPFPD